MKLNRLALFLVLFAASIGAAQSRSKTDAKPAEKREPKKHKMTDTVGVINGHVVQLYDFRETLSNIVRSAARDSIVSEADWTKYVDAAWDRIMEDVILEEEIRKYKFDISNDDALADMLQDPPPFVTSQFTDSTGVFDKHRMQAAMADPRNDSVLKILVGIHRTNMEQAKLARAIVPDAKTNEEYNERYAIWLKRKKSLARVIDKRINFGYY